MTIKKHLLIGLTSATLITAAAFASETPREQLIEDNLAPLGDVYIMGEDATTSTVTADMTPQERYQATCATCHASGLLGAPRVGNSGDWAPRMAQGEDALVTAAINGIGGMPPRGGCAPTQELCDDEGIRQVVEYMLAQSQ